MSCTVSTYEDCKNPASWLGYIMLTVADATALFNLIDRDNTGLIEKHELQSYCASHAISVSKMMDVLDPKRSSVEISKGQFLAKVAAPVIDAVA